MINVAKVKPLLDKDRHISLILSDYLNANANFPTKKIVSVP